MENNPRSAVAARIPRGTAAAFIACVIGGYAAHLFAFTNIIPNADGLSRVYDLQQMTISGRWFLHYASVFNGYLQAPAVIGFFTVLFLALSAGLTASLLNIRSVVLGAAAGLLMAVFPPVAFTLLFQFTSSAYCFGILLAVLAVWLTDRGPRLLLPGILALACAVGTYQAYIAVAAALALIRVLLYALEEGRTAGRTLLVGLRCLALLAGGLLLYYLELQFFLRVKGVELISYKGISGIGGAELPLQMLSRLGSAYTNVFVTRASPIAIVLSLGFLAAGIWSLLRIARRGGMIGRPGTLLIVAALLALLPLALNLPLLLVRLPRTYMRYSMVFGPVLVLALADRATGEKTPPPGRLPRALAALTVSLSLLTGMYCFNLDNLAYTAAATAHRTTQSFVTRLVSRVESLPGYEEGMEVVIIGSFPDVLYHSGVEAFEGIDAPSYMLLTKNKHIYYYLNDWLNVAWTEPSRETFTQIADSEVFRKMPLYPDDGSVALIDGRVVVKISVEYVPRREYEEQYEARK